MEVLRQELRELPVGKTFKFPRLLAPEEVDKILREFGCEEGVSENWNGTDLDWSTEIEFELNKFDVYGSGYSGTMVFQKHT